MHEILHELATWGIPLGVIAAYQLVTRRREPKPPSVPDAWCGCTHHLSMHDPETNQCHALVNGKAIKYDDWKEPTAWEQVQCPCRQYSGPRPIDQVFQPRMLPPADPS